MFFQDDRYEEVKLLADALQALAEVKNPGRAWLQRHAEIYAHALKMAREDRKMHAKGWKGRNGRYSRPT